MCSNSNTGPLFLAMFALCLFTAGLSLALASGPGTVGILGTGMMPSALKSNNRNEIYRFHKSETIMKEAETLMPGGVSSPVRAFKSVDSSPIVFDRVKGARITDVDGNKFIDFVGSWGTAIVGHAHDEVIASVSKTAEGGTSFGAPSRLENTLAKKVMKAFPSMELIRFTSSGTEACMGAIRAARAFTGRSKVIKISGCYHGHSDPFLVQAGSGVATLGYSDSPGVPQGATADTLVAEYNNLESVRALLQRNPGQVAAVIVEPVVGNAGFITPGAGFLQGLRDLCTDSGALLIFDEVMTGFRVAYGGAQDYFQIRPDLTTLGKIIGGGLPVGAFGGRREIMSQIAPAGPVYQAGTLSGNPLAMASGVKTLDILERCGASLKNSPPGRRNDAYDYLHMLSGRLINGLKAKFRQHYRGPPMSLQGDYINGMFGFFFNTRPVRNYRDAQKSDAGLFKRFHRGMLERGVYLPPSPYEACFMSLAHTPGDIDAVVEAAGEVFKTL